MNPKSIPRRANWFVVVLTLTILGGGPIFACWLNYQPATYVLGQPDFNSNASGPTAMLAPSSMAYDSLNKRLFVSDTFQNRVLVYDFGANPHGFGTISIPGRKPDYVLGQDAMNDVTEHSVNCDLPDCDNTTANLTWGMCVVKAVAYDASTPKGRLFVTDTYNNRVLVYDFNGDPQHQGDLSATPTKRIPDYVLGQVNLTSTVQYDNGINTEGNTNNSGSQPVSASGMYHPAGVSYDVANQRLFVGERANARVLVFDLSGGITNGMAAIDVLGQTDFTKNHIDYTQTNSGAMIPEFVRYFADATHHWLFVGDEPYNRILIFNVPPGPPNNLMTNHPNAINELGQPNMNQVGPAPTAQNTMVEASGADEDIDTQEMFAADENNHRVLIYDLTSGLSDGMNASYVLGQQDFVSHTPDVSRTAMSHVEDVVYDTTTEMLFVADSGNNRILVFTPQSDCGSLQICGTIATAREGTASSIPLPNWSVELRDKGGRLLVTKTTGPPDPALGPGAAYRFTPSDSNKIVAGGSYFVTPVVGRTQSAAPTYYPINVLPSLGGRADFQIHGVLNSIQLTRQPAMTFVLVTTTPYPKADPPNMGPGASAATSAGSGFYTAIADKTGTATLQVPAGTSYYVTCWVPQSSVATSVTYSRISTPSQGPYTVTPNQGVTATCTP